uniref:RdRp n=1 Tax=Hubei partiti-like virus 2 TaxID=1923026 RepID=A0A1L3KLG2_9VIRU|nr:RdRp [Hubei partiti-like virus 2]
MNVDTKFFKPLTPGEGFAFNYTPSRLDRNALFALNRTFDPDKISKVRTKYHRAHLNLDDLRSDLMEYSRPKVSRQVDDAYAAVFESVDQDVFGKTMIKPLTHGAVASHPGLPKQKSPGLPLKTQGYRTKGEALADPKVITAIRKQWYAIERQEDVELPDVACYARAQICSRDKNKVRATWGYPLTMYLTEGQYFYPLLDVIKEKAQPTIAYGIEIGNGGMQYIQEMLRYHGKKNYVIGDWSKFDKNVPAWLIRDAFKMMARHIQWDVVVDVEGKEWPVNPAKSKRRWERMVNYFINTPIQLSSGERFMKYGGVPSGSCFTNVVDGIVNALATRYLVYHMTGSLPLDDLYLGDDSIVITDKPLNMDVFSEKADEWFSLIYNVDKSYQTANPQNVHFLGYYNMTGVPFKPVDTTIASSVYPERMPRNKFETAVRLVGQAYSCFEPTDAKNFFRAAKILVNEMEGANLDMIKEFTADHPEFFKYLQTIGVSTKEGLSVPDCSSWDLVLLTLPHAPKKKWRPRHYTIQDMLQLAQEAIDSESH